MKNTKRFYVIEENIKNSKMFELKTTIYSDRYVRFNQSDLKKFIEKKSFKKLLNNGLFMSKKKRSADSYLTIQRLVGCLYSDISGMEMHHINKNKLDNSFENIVPLESEINTSIDSLPREEMIEFGKTKHQEWVSEINKKKRNTLTNNDYLILDILLNSINKTSKEVHKLFKRKIKSVQIIRKILNTFFYMEELFKYLKINKENSFGN